MTIPSNRQVPRLILATVVCTLMGLGVLATAGCTFSGASAGGPYGDYGPMTLEESLEFTESWARNVVPA